MMKFFNTTILFVAAIIVLTACDDDSIFYPKVTSANGITTVSGIRPGGLEKAMFARLPLVNHLVISDTINSRDFQTMRDEMPNLQTIDLSNATIAAYNGYDGTAGTREYYYPANTIPQFAFYNPANSVAKTKLKSIIFPKNIKSIGNYAFNRCTGLTGILEIPASVTDTIGNSAFGFCDGLTGLVLSGAKFIGESAFQNCSNLTGTLEIVDSTNIIKQWAFAFCPKINTISISKSVSFIGTSAFNGCGGSFSVNAANTSYSSLDGVLFNQDQSTLVQFPSNKTGNYSIPATVGVIGTYSFANCTGLTSVSIPAATYFIEDYAFSGCSGLSGKFPIPSALSFIGQYVFEGCKQLTGFDIATDNSSFSYTDGILIDLGQMMIKRCLTSKSGSYVIGSNIMFIDNAAFSDCTQLTSITVPESILFIGQRAFNNCSGLTSVYARSATPIDLTSSATAFDGLNMVNCTLYIPKGTSSAYQTAIGWKNFYNIVEN